MKLSKQAFLSGLLVLGFSSAFAQWSAGSITTDIYHSSRVGIGTSYVPNSSGQWYGSTTGPFFEVASSDLLSNTYLATTLLSSVSGKLQSNTFRHNSWMLRNNPLACGTGYSWCNVSLHDGISIDNQDMTPRTDTRTWWERDAFNDIQTWGTAATTYMKLNPGKLAINGTSGQLAALHLDNTSTSGKHWALLSAGGSNPSNGNFSIYDYNAATDRVLIDGTTGYILMGTPTAFSPYCRLHVSNANLNANIPSSYGALYGTLSEEVLSTGSTINTVYGIGGKVYSPTSLFCNVVGVQGNATIDNGSTVGVEAIAHGGSYSAGATCQGWATQNSSDPRSQAFGVDASAMGTSQGDIIGVQGSVSGSTSGNLLAGLFWGDVTVTGNLTYQGLLTHSDRKLKDQIKPLTNTLEKIMKLKPSSYVYKKDEFKDMNLPDGVQMGLIAQELEEIFPELIKNIKAVQHRTKSGEVTSSRPDYKSVNYVGLIPVLIGGIQEQQAQLSDQSKTIADLKTLVGSLQQQITDLANSSSSPGGNSSNLNRSSAPASAITINNNKNVIVLDQNVPNPFAESTIITYSIPSDFTNAQLIFNTTEGQIIKTVQITEKGFGSLTVFGNDLSNGVYTYTLVVDGKTIDSKKMIKQ